MKERRTEAEQNLTCREPEITPCNQQGQGKTTPKSSLLPENGILEAKPQLYQDLDNA